MKRYIITTITALGLSLPAFAAAAADTESKPAVSLATSAGNLHDTDLRALLREAGTRMHKHFVPDPRLPLSIDLGGLDHQELTYAQLLAVFAVNGYIAVADSGLVLVMPNSDGRQTAQPVVAPDNIRALDDEWVTTVMPLKNINAGQLVPVLRPLLPQYAQLAPFTDRNALIISDRSANVKRIVEIVKILEALPKAAEAPPPKSP
jgi:general secretion pathway protein D